MKTEDNEYFLLHSTKEKLQAGLMCSDYLSPSFGCPLRVLIPRKISTAAATASASAVAVIGEEVKKEQNATAKAVATMGEGRCQKRLPQKWIRLKKKKSV